MSDSGENNQPVAFIKYLESSRHLLKTVRSFDYKKLFQDMISFLSIIVAYFFVSLTYQFSSTFKKLLKIDLKSTDTTPLLVFLFSLYLIFWNVVAYFLEKRALKPAPKKDEYEEIPAEQPAQSLPIELPALPDGEEYAHEIIKRSVNYTIYFFLLLVCIVAYAFFNQPVRKELYKLLDVERINYIGVWFLAANLFYLVGRLFQKLTKMNEWKVLGVAIGFIVGVLSLGLANGLNTFIFI